MLRKFPTAMGRVSSLSVAALALGASSCAALVTPPPSAAFTAAPAAPTDAATAVERHSRSRRRDLLVGALGGLAAAALPTSPAHASYALYQSSYDSFQERKATNYVPVATSDTQTLEDIQAQIRRKRPSTKPAKAPQYCAGQTASVTPMLENVCANIGVSKADQSNTMTDACARRLARARRLRHAPHPPAPAASAARLLLTLCARCRVAVGNMNIGAYSSMSGSDRLAQEQKLQRVQQAAEAARLRQSVKRQ